MCDIDVSMSILLNDFYKLRKEHFIAISKQNGEHRNPLNYYVSSCVWSVSVFHTLQACVTLWMYLVQEDLIYNFVVLFIKMYRKLYKSDDKAIE